MQFYAIVKETFIFRLKNKNKSKHEFVVELLPRNIIKKTVCYTVGRYLCFPLKIILFKLCIQHVQYIAKKRKYGTIQGIIIQVGYIDSLIANIY